MRPHKSLLSLTENLVWLRAWFDYIFTNIIIMCGVCARMHLLLAPYLKLTIKKGLFPPNLNKGGSKLLILETSELFR